MPLADTIPSKGSPLSCIVIASFPHDRTAEFRHRLLWLSQASQDEWDEFESGHALAYERRLAEHPDDTAVRERADRQRTWRLKGWRGVLGMVYLTLVLPR